MRHRSVVDRVLAAAANLFSQIFALEVGCVRIHKPATDIPHYPDVGDRSAQPIIGLDKTLGVPPQVSLLQTDLIGIGNSTDAEEQSFTDPLR